MWLHALDISYDRALAPRAREEEEDEEVVVVMGREVWLESELTASELIQAQSSRRECSSVILLAERVIGGERQREECKPVTERMRNAESWSGTTIAGCSSGGGHRQRERSEEHTAAL
ncbi:hypothetical protein XENOCAPTIV_001029 [Xenoophorus captivus]|uniref:Uncharacterized protein n=1 Tax=Xenoophorus captivus TaxID=1517983 RepID=A0ABV0S6C3_9TELE